MIRSYLKRIYNSSKLARYYWLKFVWYNANKNMKLSDEEYAKKYYYKNCNKELDLTKPRTYDDKVWYLKLHNRDPLITKCSDKYKVREYVTEKGLSDTLIKLYGVFENAFDIDFAKFDKPVFLKCNHTSGYNAIYYPERKFDKNDFIRRFNFILNQNYYLLSREWNYKDIKPMIIAEEVIFNEDGSLPIDYKFFCFKGEPKLLQIMIGTCDENGEHAKKENRYVNTYDMDFNLTSITQGYRIYRDSPIKVPVLFNEMKQYARILSSEFEFCRVDLYEVKEKIYFGEMTFYDGGGCNNTQPLEWDLLMGSWIDINNIKGSN